MATPISEILRTQQSQQAQTQTQTQSNLEQLLGQPTRFNAEAWHAMNARDDQMIADSILHGYVGAEYVYQFSIGGKQVEGISVVGARALAAEYGGIKVRIVASLDKTGQLFVQKSYEPLAIAVQHIPDLEDTADYYEVLMEVQDLKTGNAIQVRKKEFKTEKRRDGTSYDRPHYDSIAESKAYRNGVLDIIPQRVVMEFKRRSIKAGKGGAEKTKDQLMEGCLRYAASQGIGIDRQLLGQLTYAEIYGLGEAAKTGVSQFKVSSAALGINTAVTVTVTDSADEADESNEADLQTNTQAKRPTLTEDPQEELDSEGNIK